MSLMLLMAAKRAKRPRSQTFTANGTFTPPAGSSSVSLSGMGPPGTPEHTDFVQSYTENLISYNQQNSQGGVIRTRDQWTIPYLGPKPQDYCTDHTGIRINGVLDFVWLCYFYKDTSGMVTTPATTGPSATGFGKVFPGGFGGPGSATTFSDVPVTPGYPYPITVPEGGSVTVNYFI